MVRSLHGPRLAFRDLAGRYAPKIGVLGFVGDAIDVGVFNVLRVEHHCAIAIVARSVNATVISVAVATLVT